MRKKILLVEDDQAISDMIKNYLSKEGFEITTAFDGNQGINLCSNNYFNLIILDLMLPKLDGMDFLKLYRVKNLTPVLIVSAKSTDTDKAIGLGFGADDYITKPFSMIELLARVKALIRRATEYSDEDKKMSKIQRGELTIDIANFSVQKSDKDIKLTVKEYKILKLLASNPKRVFTKAQIYQNVWNEEYFGDDNVINVHMRRLREKLENDPSNPTIIKTIWGIGYKLGDY